MTASKLSISATPRKSLVDIAAEFGLLDITPSDLVCESSANGIFYYDYVLSCHHEPITGKVELYLAKFDNRMNLECLESCTVPAEHFDDGLSRSDLALMTLGVLIWKHQIAKCRLLCLVRDYDEHTVSSLEALKRATSKFRCLHHVHATGRRRGSNASTDSSSGRNSPSGSHYVTEGMKMRVMLCQSRTVLDAVPPQAIRETKALLNPASNPILCLCFPLV